MFLNLLFLISFFFIWNVVTFYLESKFQNFLEAHPEASPYIIRVGCSLVSLFILGFFMSSSYMVIQEQGGLDVLV